MTGTVNEGRMTISALRGAIDAGEIDTVLVAFCDHLGRLVGKRVTGWYFRDHVLRNQIEACTYLLCVDVDMNPVEGYRYANWETGYGDFTLVADTSTLRRVPWLERTALVLCDLAESDGTPVAVSPRQVLRRQIARAADYGLTVKVGAELEFFLFKESYAEAAGDDYRSMTPHSDWVEDYHILQTSRDEYLIRAIRNAMDGAAVPVEFSKGEAGRGQHEINLIYAEALEMADRHAIYKNGVKEIAEQHRRSVTFMAKYDADEVGSSCHIHASLWDQDGHPLGHDPRFRAWLGGLVTHSGDLALCFAPYLNSYKRYRPDSWAPTALAWGRDNRTCGLRLVGHGANQRVETRIPGADVNPYLAVAGVIAAGLAGIAEGADPGDELVGNAYTAADVTRLPATLVEAIDAWERSDLPDSAFGSDAAFHVAQTARAEWAAANATVTDWERRRGFERL